ncbi:MAG: TolC family protein [Myxococcales bacterium]
MIKTPCFSFLTLLCVGAMLELTLPTKQAHAEAAADSATRATFRAESASSLADLEAALAERAPEVTAARRDAALSDAEVRQSHLYNNPQLDTSWGTLPVGASNPAGLAHPYANVPNYGIGFTQTIPIGKRGPRQRQAKALSVAAHANVEVTTRSLAFDLADILGELATSTLRREGFAELEASAERSLTLAKSRLATQFGTGLDVDRSSIDAQRVKQQRLGSESAIREQLAACSSLVMRPCEGFADSSEALSYLHTWLEQTQQSQAPLKQRPDLRVLEAEAHAASAALDLAKAERIPDPTVRLGYLHDRFVVSGNQRNSVNAAISLPLPLFDHGQAKRAAAEAARRSLEQERQQLLQRAQRQAPLLAERSELARELCQRLEREILPQARGVLDNLEHAEASRLVSMTEVIQARRTVSELLLEEADSCGDAYQATLALLREAPRSEP